MDVLKVGGEIEAFCPTCKTTKWQIVVALVDGKPAKLECIGCHRQHGMRSTRAGRKEASPRPRAAAAPPPAPTVDLDTRLAGREHTARAYSPRTGYDVDEVIRHPTFGVGLVVALPAPQKMEVQFRTSRKVLVHDQEAAAQPLLSRPARPEADEAPRQPPDAAPRK
ncbi:MAG TPA: hypothetical protein VGQ83_36875 [Polyangia bacterium]|jgi:hypothetical protein